MWLVDGALDFAPYFGIPFAILALLAAGLWLRWRRRLVLVACLPLAAWIALMATGIAMLDHGQACGTMPALRVATVNVMMDNPELPSLADNVLAERPDVVVFEELRYDLESFSPALAAAYPYRISTETPWVTLASRLPLEDAQRLTLPIGTIGRDGREPLTATIDVGGQLVKVLAVHAIVPRDAADYVSHGVQYGLMAQAAEASKAPVIAIGDFNATVFSPSFMRLLLATKLRIASSEWWQAATHFPRAHFGLRIDHVLVRNLDVCGEQVFDLAGSDHHGVMAEIRLPGGSGLASNGISAATSGQTAAR